jgi:hypothetical protein
VPIAVRTGSAKTTERDVMAEPPGRIANDVGLGAMKRQT